MDKSFRAQVARSTEFLRFTDENPESTKITNF
jgi:hypothetical protein